MDRLKSNGALLEVGEGEWKPSTSDIIARIAQARRINYCRIVAFRSAKGRTFAERKATINLESEILHLPELRPFVGHRVEITVRESDGPHQSEAERQSALELLRATWERCRQSNGDGEGAEAIPSETYELARRFLESLPSGSPLPSISAEPDGHWNFEWYQAPRRMLSVSVGSDGTLYWAALIGSEDPRGSCQFADEFPQTLLYWIGQIYG